MPATLTDSQQVDSGVDFGIDGRSVRVSQEAYSIFLAREAAGREKIAALQQRLTAADERVDAGISCVTRMIKCAGGQPSIATSYLRDILDKLKPAEGGKPSTCTWTESEFSWHTGCGKEWQFTDGGLPSENGMHFCHSCGKKLSVETTQKNFD
ncbi:hypothetical protein B1R45_13505 [Pseudomonas azotoformans]|nr:hypothetical protein B1R45_13505 [Pseudomonas azotoformans]